ncbi:MAG: flagellar basal body-associated protein FliL [Nitrincola lacisaponensis]|uniref:flagellar basal body-associated FliL family protein n=1 Tax=Nitrincola lacisaponensis TaxID=267850 RepID=UPI00391A938A
MNVLTKRVLLMLVLVVFPPSWVQAEEYLNYIELQSFVTNFGEVQTGPLRFMKADVTLHLAPGGSRIDVEKHKAHIRNDLIFLFKAQKEADLATVEAQMLLAQRALRVVQQVLVDETGHPHVDDLFFTSLVIQ